MKIQTVQKIVFLWLICAGLLFPEFALCKSDIHIIYDSFTQEEGLKADWGFSAVVTIGKTRIMIDTGLDPSILKNNMKKLGYTPKDFDYVVISHWHPDHYGGFYYMLSHNPSIQAYLPTDFKDHNFTPPADWKISTVKDYTKIKTGIYVLQTNPKNKKFKVKQELTLAIITKDGPTLISGCFHTGWPQMIQKTKEITSKNVYLIVGGGRFIDRSESELNSLAKELQKLGLKNVGLSHCAAGPIPNAVFGKYYGKHSIYSRLGAVIVLPE